MLKYEINVKEVNDAENQIDLYAISCHDYYADSSKVEVRNIYSNDIKTYVGMPITVVSTIFKENVFNTALPIYETDNVEIVQCDNLNKTFSFISDKYQDLKLSSISIVVEDTVLYLHFFFDEWHYFNSWNDYGITFYVHYMSNKGEYTQMNFSRCQVVTDMELKWRYDAGTYGIDNFMCSIFRNDKYELKGYGDYGESVDPKYIEVEEIPETACFTDELFLKKRVVYSSGHNCWRWELYEKQCNDGDLTGVSSNRLNYKFKDVENTAEYTTNALASINVPLSVESSYDTYQEQNINSKFVQEQVKSSKNGITEMEKFCYHPVFRLGVIDYNQTSGGGQVVNRGEIEYKPIHKIKINLHFREREKEGWIVKQNGYWNGMNSNGLYGDVFNTNNEPKFFSYIDGNSIDGYGVDCGRQSDLLCYLGFTDTDVKYQKSKLKKSFLRLSFYDSPNVGDQNLLCYSTVFVDSSNLLVKMMRGAKRKNKCNQTSEGLYVVSGQIGSEHYDDIKTNTEPCMEKTKFGIEDAEQFRLSSQFVIKDRLSSESSDGFYLYLWADNDNGAVPSDIYMKVDFCHAGYGRVIPFTMPYLDTVHEKRIYTFEEVSYEWCVNGGWGVKTNDKYSYIHFKYVYDKKNRRHVYFLDDETYGLGSYNDSTPDELELNLYESKINFE